MLQSSQPWEKNLLHMSLTALFGLQFPQPSPEKKNMDITRKT
jgi:hypothetical protein